MVPPAASIPGPPPGDASPASINSINEATIFASAVGPSKDLRERNLDAAMNGNARDARVVPRDGKGGDGACRRAAASALARGATIRKPARLTPQRSGDPEQIAAAPATGAPHPGRAGDGGLGHLPIEAAPRAGRGDGEGNTWCADDLLRPDAGARLGAYPGDLSRGLHRSGADHGGGHGCRAFVHVPLPGQGRRWQGELTSCCCADDTCYSWRFHPSSPRLVAG